MDVTSLLLAGVLQVEECCLLRPILLAYSDRWSFGGKLDNSILTGSRPNSVSIPASMSGMMALWFGYLMCHEIKLPQGKVVHWLGRFQELHIRKL
jgi:hypothetical protein